MFAKKRTTRVNLPPVQGCCAWQGCAEDGRFPAPRDPRNLARRQYFCEAHIKAFNARWDGLKGFSENEIFGLQNGAATVGRPTWAMGLNAAAVDGAKVEKMFATAQDLFAFFEQRMEREKGGKLPSSAALPPDVKEACVIMNLPQPLPAAELKSHYLTLMKQHHPDVNDKMGAEEYTKRINVAYQILVAFGG